MRYFFDNLEKFSNNTAIITQSAEEINYREIIKKSDKIFKDIKNRSLIFLICNNNLETILGYYGLLKKNCVVALIDSKINKFFLEKLIKNYAPEYIFLPKKLNDLNISYSSVSLFNNYQLLKINKKIDYSINDQLALLINTSGSTGSPKFVRHSYENISNNIDSVLDYIKLDSNNKSITSMPFSYTYGLSTVNIHLYIGGSIVMTEKNILEKDFWNLFHKHKVDNLNGVPYTYKILEKLKFYNFNLSSLKFMTQAGGHLDEETSLKFLRIFEKNKIKFFKMYGQTEASPRMSYVPHNKLKEKINSIGIPVKGGKFEIVNNEKKVIQKPNETGDLVYKGKNVCLGYATSYKDLVKEDENKGILETGDLAKRDNDNYFYLVGRRKRFIKAFGYRINLDDIESILISKGYECACKGNDEKIEIFLSDEKCNQKDIQDYIFKMTNIHNSAIDVKIIKKIPRNSSGKIDYEELN